MCRCPLIIDTYYNLTLRIAIKLYRLSSDNKLVKLNFLLSFHSLNRIWDINCAQGCYNQASNIPNSTYFHSYYFHHFTPCCLCLDFIESFIKRVTVKHHFYPQQYPFILFFIKSNNDDDNGFGYINRYPIEYKVSVALGRK